MSLCVEKLAKEWIFKLTPESLHFIVQPQTIHTGLQLWAQLSCESVMDDYKVESALNDQIWIQVTGEDFSKVFKSAMHSSKVMMKLTKKDQLPVLSFSITAQSKNGKPIMLTQNLPVKVLNQDEAMSLQEPAVPDADVNIMLPSISTLKNNVEKLKSFSNFITISANMNGEFKLNVENEHGEAESFFEDLVNPELDPNQVDILNQPSMSRKVTEFASARVNIKDFIKFLHCQVINPTNIVCCIIQDYGIVLYVYVGNANDEQNYIGTATYYLPHKMD